jgi:hypothetical protein
LQANVINKTQHHQRLPHAIFLSNIDQPDTNSER